MMANCNDYNAVISNCVCCGKSYSSSFGVNCDMCYCCSADILPFHGVSDLEFCMSVCGYFLTDCLPSFSSRANNDDYFTPKQIADVMNVEKIKSLLMMHFNTRSLVKNKDLIEEFILEINHLPEVIAISETKINENIHA